MSAPNAEVRRYTVSQLSAESGISVASIKFYLRDGLLPGGDLRGAHREFYDAGHLACLRLISALRDVARIPVATIRELFAAIDGGGSGFEVVARAIDTLRLIEPAPRSAALASARADIRGLLAQLDVRARPDAGAVEDLAQALLRLRELWGALPVTSLLPYAHSMRDLARLEAEANRAAFAQDPRSLLRLAVLGTVLFEPILLALRRVMHEDAAKRLLTRPRRRKTSARKTSVQKSVRRE